MQDTFTTLEAACSFLQSIASLFYTFPTARELLIGLSSPFIMHGPYIISNQIHP
ncbi:unnamed protein product [Sphenostylis stenocarpa]|uniref:Uncharacterized protein n=1 Tax=Sphenostylis stenocarpa TaxID=92480 RepID=A0AA86V8P3_9FABA|nr:unnamed protein product [Sphenostylis stenocarpa]